MITNQNREYSEVVKGSSPSFTTVKRTEIKIFGWIFDFFPYKIIYERTINSHKEEVYSLERNDIKIYQDSYFDMLPEEMINIEASYRNINGQTALFGIKSGFLGYSLNIKNEFKPEIGWYFYIKDDPFSLLK